MYINRVLGQVCIERYAPFKSRLENIGAKVALTPMFSNDTRSYFGHVSALVKLEFENGMFEAVLHTSLNREDAEERLNT